jgi:hypothetical protein
MFWLFLYFFQNCPMKTIAQYLGRDSANPVTLVRGDGAAIEITRTSSPIND